MRQLILALFGKMISPSWFSKLAIFKMMVIQKEKEISVNCICGEEPEVDDLSTDWFLHTKETNQLQVRCHITLFCRYERPLFRSLRYGLDFHPIHPSDFNKDSLNVRPK